MDDRPTHTITVIVKQRYMHGQAMGDCASVTVDGEGDVEHFETAFQAALVACGFSAGLPVKIGAD